MEVMRHDVVRSEVDGLILQSAFGSLVRDA